MWNNWFYEQWQPWADETRPKLSVQKLYGELFSVYQRLQREGESVELVWGHGILAWNKLGCQIKRPLITSRVEAIFDATLGLFKLVPMNSGINLETDMLSGIEIPNPQHIAAIERRIAEMAWIYGTTLLQDSYIRSRR